MNHEWIGVDFDKTLAVYEDDFHAPLGPPIPRMLTRVKKMLADGEDVRIVTARVNPVGYPEATESQVLKQRELVKAWTRIYVERELRVGYAKDRAMKLLYDDRAVQVHNGATIPELVMEHINDLENMLYRLDSDSVGFDALCMLKERLQCVPGFEGIFLQ